MRLEQKQSEFIVSLDIGSTFTKAAVFQVEWDKLILKASARVPTTVDSLIQGVCQVLESLDCMDVSSGRPRYPVYFSSSAKGGLQVIAVGLVPELTLKVAKLTALSAGARVTQSFGYKLTASDIGEIDRLRPDIILFSGGTDGGNEAYVCYNAQRLSQLAVRPQIIYAGNQVMYDQVRELLSDFSVHAAANVLPELDRCCVDDARRKICEVFLETIVVGKGLDAVIDLLGCDPLPTPLAVIQLVEAIGRMDAPWSDFCLVDIGGATTDFYSCCSDTLHESNVVYRGLSEPKVKRTVEGDLGIRCNAPSVMLAASQWLQQSKSTTELLAMMDYIHKITQETGYLPKTSQERQYDRTLAEICITQGVQRHAGTQRRVFGSQGEMFIQTGKDLRAVDKMILTGGFLSSLDDEEGIGDVWEHFKAVNDSAGELVYLVPQDVHYYQDRNYLFPLLGNLVRDYSRQASQAAVQNLVPFASNRLLQMDSRC